MAATGDKPRLHGLDSLRAVAILLVMLFHLQAFLPPALGPVAQYGWMGVDLFFVLSGYLIGASLLRPYAQGRPARILDFYRRRAYRILPAYLVVLGLYAFVPLWRETPGLSPPWQFMTFTENLLVDYGRNQAFSHAWSLCVEEHFYLLLPLLLAWVLRGVALRKAILLGAGLVLAGIAIRLFVLVHGLTPLAAEGKPFWQPYLEQVYYPTYTRLDGLLAGVSLAAIELFRPRWWLQMTRWRHYALVGGALLVAVCCWLFHDRFTRATGAAAVGTVVGFPILSVGLGLVVFSALARGGALQRLPVPGAKTIATLAFSLYLTHKEAVHLSQLLLPGFTQGNGWEQLAYYAASCALVAWLLYLGVERPFLLLREKWSHRGSAELERTLERDPAL